MCVNRRSFIKTAGLLGGACALVPQCVFAAGQFSTEPYTDNNQLPTKFRIDACTLCQLDCPACPSREFLDANKHYGYLKFKDFKKFVDENAVDEIELSSCGEIFLNPELIDIIKYAHEKNITLTAFGGVNGNTITDEMAEALVKYQFRHMHFSLDGASQEVYSIYRRGGDFDKVISNIKKINALKAEHNSLYPMMLWRYVVFGHNVCDMLKAKKMAQELGIGFQYSMNNDRRYSQLKEEDKAFVQKETGTDNTLDFFGSNEFVQNLNCADLFLAPQISFDGQLLGCACNHSAFFKGNVFKHGLKKALNKPDYLYTKKMLTGQTPEKKSIPCAGCFTYQRMKSENSWVKG